MALIEESGDIILLNNQQLIHFYEVKIILSEKIQETLLENGGNTTFYGRYIRVESNWREYYVMSQKDTRTIRGGIKPEGMYEMVIKDEHFRR